MGPEVSIVSGSYVSAGLTFPASNGNQWLDLTGDLSNTLEGVEQSVATVTGKTYDLSFDVGNQVNPGGPYGTTSTVQVLVNGSVAGTFTNSGVTGSTSQSWENFKTSFVASGTTTSIEFQNLDPRTDNTNGLDNVVLTGAAGPSVPEPATLGLLVLGLADIGLHRRRRS